MKQEKKFEMIQEDSMIRIKAIRDFGNVKKGEIGGLIEKEDNLSHDGDCWVYRDVYVSGNARVFGNARVSGESLC